MNKPRQRLIRMPAGAWLACVTSQFIIACAVAARHSGTQQSATVMYASDFPAQAQFEDQHLAITSEQLQSSSRFRASWGKSKIQTVSFSEPQRRWQQRLLAASKVKQQPTQRAPPPGPPSPSPSRPYPPPAPSPKPSPAYPSPSPAKVAPGQAVLPASNTTANFPSANAYFTNIYGQTGEKWVRSTTLSQRLFDWSYAGYSAGEEPIPEVPIACSVKDFGAEGDGIHDDSAAFLKAINATSFGAIYIPTGRYLLNTQLVITKPGVVLRGAGPLETTLYFNKSLTDLFGQSWSGGVSLGDPTDSPHSDWANAPGLIRFLGPDPEHWEQIATITANASRGSQTVMVSNTSQLVPGMWLSFSQADDGSLSMDYDLVSRNKCQYPWCISAVDTGDPSVLRWHSRILSLGPGNKVVLERPLPFNVSTAWSPSVYFFMTGITEVGIEDLTIEMRWQQYLGHFKEAGWNGIEFNDASQCWARNINILNGDTVVSLYRSSFCTVSDVTIGVTQSRGNYGIDCHHALNVSSSQDVLLANFTIDITCYHDLAVFNHTVGVVFANGTGVNICMDHHRFYPYAMLWSNISIGAGSRPFLSGGHTPWGTMSASFTTFWNITSKAGLIKVGPPGWDTGPQINFVGMSFDPSCNQFNTNNAVWLNWYREDVPPGMALTPGELYTAMLARRLTEQAPIAHALVKPS